jgi:hypothetical protein
MVTHPHDVTKNLSPASPAVCIAEAAKEAIDMAMACRSVNARDNQLLRAIQQITYLRGH